MNGAGLPRSRAPSIAERLRRIESRATTSATNVKVEHTQERHGAPHAGVSSACAGHRRPRAAEHRLPGWESSSRSTGRPDPTKLRQLSARGLLESKAGTLVGQVRRPKTRSGFSALRAPRLALRPAARTVRSSDEPECLPAGRNHDSSPGLAADSSGGGSDVHFSRGRRRTLDGARRSARGREAAPVAQHATRAICLRRPNDVLRNVSLASRCAASFVVHSSHADVSFQAKNKLETTFSYPQDTSRIPHFVLTPCARKTPIAHSCSPSLPRLSASCPLRPRPRT
jgi:hypothetical protein